MSESKELNSQKKSKAGRVKLFLLEVALGFMAISVWAQIAGLMGIVFPWMNIIFVVAWVVFWMAPVGYRVEAVLREIVGA